MNKDLIEWVEEQAQVNLNFRLACTDALLKECSTTLTILLAGCGGVMAYIVKSLEPPHHVWLISGSCALLVYLLVLSILLVVKCMKVDEIQVPTNEPKNLFQKQFSLGEIREAELDNIQERIDKAARRNAGLGEWLNDIRLFAIGSPLVFILVAGLSQLVS